MLMHQSQNYNRIKNYFESKNNTNDETIMDYCAKLGDLELLKELYDQGHTCTTNAIDWAAGKGYFEIVVWLVGIQQECTHHAIDNASVQGHIEIVRFLHLIGKSYSRRAVNGALLGGHLDILKYFHEEIKIDFTIKMLNRAIKYNQIEIAEYIESKLIVLK